MYEANELAKALKFAEELRSRRAAGEKISHVAIQSELPQHVGRAGVADPEPGYAHYRRRIDPASPLGHPSGAARRGNTSRPGRDRAACWEPIDPPLPVQLHPQRFP